MRRPSLISLLGIFISMICFASLEASLLLAVGTHPLILVELSSFIIVVPPAFALYYGAFRTRSINRTTFLVFKLRWLQNVLLQLGIIGAPIGIAFISAGVTAVEDMDDFIPILGGGLAISHIALWYGFICAVLIYFIEKWFIATKKDEKFESRIVKLGTNVRSVIGLFVALFFFFGAILIVDLMQGINPMPIFFNLQVVFLVGTFVFVSIAIYGGKATIQSLRVPFWHIIENDENLLSILTAIRGNKRIIALLGLAVGFITIISLLKLRFDAFLPLMSMSSILFWCLLLILFLNLAEGRIVQQIYFQTGEIHHEDRLFVVKFILPPFLLLYFSLWIVILFLLIA